MKIIMFGFVFQLIISNYGLAKELPLFKGVNITPAVKYFSTQMKTLNKSVTIYNWKNESDKVSDEDRLDSELQYNQIEKETASFWSWYGDISGEQNMYGAGLYGAVDPVSSNTFGAGSRWRLIEMKLPVGFKMLDLNPYLEGGLDDKQLTADIVSVSQKFKCPTFSKIEALFNVGGAKLDQKCQDLVRHIFKDILELDGFAYPYMEAHFAACAKSDLTGQQPRAFVITDDNWMTPELINVYTEKTKDKKEERIRIQTLFFDSVSIQANALVEGSQNIISEYLNNHFDYIFSGSKSQCTAENCSLIMRFCNSENKCDELSIGVYPRPGGPLITDFEALQTPRKNLLWNDLAGERKSAITSEWLLKNKFSCSGELPYANDKK